MTSKDKIVYLHDIRKNSNILWAETDLDKIDPFIVEDVLLTDYVMYRVSKIGYPDLDLFPRRVGRVFSHPFLTQILECMISKADEFESQFYPKFQNRKSLLQKVPECAFLDFKDTIHGIFSDNFINWGRIIGLCAFVGSYCQACVDLGMVRIVCSLVEYAVKYMDKNLSSWMVDHGGWYAFYEAVVKEEFQLKLARG